MRIGKSWRHVHLAADNLDIRPGFASVRGVCCLIELAKSGHSRRIPIRAAERLRQVGVIPMAATVASMIAAGLRCPDP